MLHSNLKASALSTSSSYFCFWSHGCWDELLRERWLPRHKIISRRLSISCPIPPADNLPVQISSLAAERSRTLIQQLPCASQLKHFHGMKMPFAARAAEIVSAASKFTFAAKGLIQIKKHVWMCFVPVLITHNRNAEGEDVERDISNLRPPAQTAGPVQSIYVSCDNSFSITKAPGPKNMFIVILFRFYCPSPSRGKSMEQIFTG